MTSCINLQTVIKSMGGDVDMAKKASPLGGAQARAAATRQRLIDAAVELFTDHGYFATGLTDITSRANVTTGAFYYHFSSKEALAMAIVDNAWPKVIAEVTRSLNAPSPGLEKVIVMTFRVSELMKRDKSVWIANHLSQAFGRLSIEGRCAFQEHVSKFIHCIADALGDADLREGVTPKQVGSLVWMALQGCHMLSDALMDSDSPAEQLRLSWSVGLRSMAPPESLPYFQEFTNRVARQYVSLESNRSLA